MSENALKARYGTWTCSEDAPRYCENDVLVTNEILRKQFKEEKEMNRRIALIGSMKHKNAMIDIYNRLTLRGHCVYLPYMGIIPEDADEDMIEKLHELHQDKMQESDFVVVVDKDGYIGKDTQVEIKWCENSGKRIIYASDFAMFDTLQSEEKSVVNDPMVPPARSKKYTIN